MANKKIRMRPEGTNDYADVLHPETTASVVIEETDKRFMTDAERTKLSGIATNANNYTHPASHPASMITESSTKRFVSDSEKATWNSKSDTDTVTTINGKTGAIEKEDIVALGIPAQDTVVDISGKADITYVDSQDALKADKTEVAASLELKADKTYVDSLYIDAGDSIDLALLELKADKTYVDNKVQTDVPSGAEFTDTVTTINGKTGAISKDDIVALGIPSADTNTITTINGKTGEIAKEDIVALGIPSQDTTYSIATTSADGLMSSTDKQNLEENTTSRHTHINKAVIDKFSEVDNKPYYDGVEIGGGSIVLGTTSSTAFRGDYGQTAYTHSQSAHAPTNAQKNSDITKAEIEAKLTGIIDTHTHPGVVSIVDLGTFNDETELITHVIMNQLPTGHYTFIIDDVPVFMLLYKGLTHYYGTFHDTGAIFYYFEVSFTGEIRELKTIHLRDFDDIIPLITDMFGDIDDLHTNFSGLLPASGGVLENYTERLYVVSASDGIIDLSTGNVFDHTPSGNTTYSITNPVSGVAHSFTLIINIGEIARTLTFPASVKWQGGEIPDMTTANKTYVLTFMSVDGGTTWLGMFGGEF